MEFLFVGSEFQINVLLIMYGKVTVYKYSETPPYDHLVNTATSLLWPLFFCPGKHSHISL